jgi:penicillin-binding protein 1A
VWSIGLGSQVVTPLEQTNFYSTIARGGVRKDPHAVRAIKDAGGTKLELPYPKPRRVMKDWQAAKIVSILEDNVRGGTGTGAQIGRLAAGKTGTTDDHKDAWFCGMTPELTACVWMGYNIPTPMPGVAGGSYPATIWRKFMQGALVGRRYGPEHQWFTVRGTEQWNPFTSGAWMDNPGIDAAFGTADPTATEEDADAADGDTKKPSHKTTTGGGGATTPPPAPSPTPPPPPPPPTPMPPPPPPPPPTPKA